MIVYTDFFVQTCIIQFARNVKELTNRKEFQKLIFCEKVTCVVKLMHSVFRHSVKVIR